jgi:hypothetical protein
MTQDEIQKQIQDNVDKKEKRYNKTELSIAHRWAVNNAVPLAIAKFPPSKKAGLETNEDYQQEILKWRDWFIDMDREWMMENMSEEIIPIADKNEFSI